jgi:hypothetical protein
MIRHILIISPKVINNILKMLINRFMYHCGKERDWPKEFKPKKPKIRFLTVMKGILQIGVVWLKQQFT